MVFPWLQPSLFELRRSAVAIAKAEAPALQAALVGLADQQAVLRRDIGGDQLRPDAVALLLQLQRPRDVHGQRPIDPAGQIGIVIGVEIVTTSPPAGSPMSTGQGASCTGFGRFVSS
jgi:hypothetical protein